MNPLIAFLSKTKEVRITESSLLNLCISCNRTVFRDEISPYLSGLNMSFFPFDFSKRPGSPFFSSFDLSITISSGVLPPAAPPILGYMLRIVYTILSDSWFWKVIFAFSCSPNTSGLSMRGSPSMYSLYTSMGPICWSIVNA